MIRAGTIVGAATASTMELAFSAQIWRATVTTSPIGTQLTTYAKHGGILPCDVLPLSDELRVMQVGQNEVISYVLHFFENTDVNTRDIVEIVSNVKLGSASVPNYFYIIEVLSPTESNISYVRCRARVGDNPTTVP